MKAKTATDEKEKDEWKLEQQVEQRKGIMSECPEHLREGRDHLLDARESISNGMTANIIDVIKDVKRFEEFWTRYFLPDVKPESKDLIDFYGTRYPKGAALLDDSKLEERFYEWIRKNFQEVEDRNIWTRKEKKRWWKQ